MNELETALHEARMFSLVLNSVIGASGMDKLDHHGTLSSDQAEQLIWVGLKLEHFTLKASEAFQAAMPEAAEGGAA